MKYSLDKTWELCLEMWPDLVAEWKKTGKDIIVLKGNWMERKGFEDILNDCFFCHYAGQDEYGGADCTNCPAILVDPGFDCKNSNYYYRDKPDLFLAKIVELNKRRLKMKCAKLICSDGTEVEISEETERNLREKFGKKKEFEPIQLCHLRVDVAGGGAYAILSWYNSSNTCSATLGDLRRTIAAIQSAIDYIEKK